MTNTMTDQFNLIQEESARGFTGLFGRTLWFRDGFSLEIFRNNIHIGSILSKEIEVASDVKKRFEWMAVRSGDKILQVNLGPRMFSLTGKLSTQDGYVRDYEIDLEIRVSNPTFFAQAYLQQSDPLFLAKKIIEGDLQRYADRTNHNDIDPAHLRFQAEAALDKRSNQLPGIAVIRAYRAALKIDPRLAEILDIEQMRMKRVVSERKQFEMELEERVNYAKEAIHYSKETEEPGHVKDDVVDFQFAQVAEKLRMGTTLDEIIKENPEVQNLFQMSTRINSVTLFPPAEDQKRPNAGPENKEKKSLPDSNLPEGKPPSTTL